MAFVIFATSINCFALSANASVFGNNHYIYSGNSKHCSVTLSPPKDEGFYPVYSFKITSSNNGGYAYMSLYLDSDRTKLYKELYYGKNNEESIVLIPGKKYYLDMYSYCSYDYYSKDTDFTVDYMYSVYGKNLSYADIKVGNKYYTGKSITPSVSVKFGGYSLKKGTDYKVSLSNNKNIGKAKAEITGIGKASGTVTKTFKILPVKVKNLKAVPKSTSSIKFSWSKSKGASYYSIYLEDKFYKNIKGTSITISTDSKGKKLKPGAQTWIKIKAVHKKKDGTKYSSPYTYSQTVTKPVKPALTSVKSTAKGKIKVSWKKVSSAHDGFVVYYSTDKNFKKNVKKVYVNDYEHKVTSKTISKLKSKKKYYFYVKAYSWEYYGDDSDIKRITGAKSKVLSAKVK